MIHWVLRVGARCPTQSILLLDVLLVQETLFTTDTSTVYCLDKKRDDKTYWRCTDKTCPGRLNLMNDTTVTSMEPHSHPLTPAANSIHTAKLKASDTDLPMKHLIATLLDHSLSKPYQVNCQSRHLSLRLHAMLGPPGGFRTRVRLISVFLAVL